MCPSWQCNHLLPWFSHAWCPQTPGNNTRSVWWLKAHPSLLTAMGALHDHDLSGKVLQCMAKSRLYTSQPFWGKCKACNFSVSFYAMAKQPLVYRPTLMEKVLFLSFHLTEAWDIPWPINTSLLPSLPLALFYRAVHQLPSSFPH